jgi:hypothetical protein
MPFGEGDKFTEICVVYMGTVFEKDASPFALCPIGSEKSHHRTLEWF